jgi:erythromycin esterase-like protein
VIDRGAIAPLDSATLAPVSPDDARIVDRLLDRIDSARIVLLGELSHWIAEKSTFRLWWLERLAARHQLVLAEELGHSDGIRVARYLASGDEAWLDRVPMFGWRGDVRADRDDRPTGVLRASFERYPTARFKRAQCAFYRRVRALAPRAFHGIDVNAVAGAGYADIRGRLPSIEPTLSQRIARQLTWVPGESPLAEAERLEALRAALAGQARGDPALTAVLVDLDVMARSLRYQALAHPAQDYEALRPAMSLREDMMKRALDRMLAALRPEEKLVLMGHALHLVKDDARVADAPGVGPGGGHVHSLGHYLAQECGEPVFASWFVFGEGSDCQPFPDLPSTYRFPEATLNRTLLANGVPAVVDVAAGASPASVGVGHLYNLVAEVDLRAQVDAVFFLPTVHPLP